MNSGPVVGVPLPQHTRQGFAGLRTSTLPLPSQASHKNLMCSPVPLQIAHDTFIVGTLTPEASVLNNTRLGFKILFSIVQYRSISYGSEAART